MYWHMFCKMCIYDYEQTINYNSDIIIMYKCFVNFERSIRIGIQENKSQKKNILSDFCLWFIKIPSKRVERVDFLGAKGDPWMEEEERELMLEERRAAKRSPRWKLVSGWLFNSSSVAFSETYELEVLLWISARTFWRFLRREVWPLFDFVAEEHVVFPSCFIMSICFIVFQPLRVKRSVVSCYHHHYIKDVLIHEA